MHRTIISESLAGAGVDLAPERLQHDVPRSPGMQRLLSVTGDIGASSVVVISNREPYVHERADGGGIVVRRPPGGLVTAIEPLLEACGGTWIAHGAGSADAEAAGPDATVAVPPGQPSYTLQRVFLSEAEVRRYYCGFANEALWPLCHRVHERPVFRYADWLTYRDVNARFAEAAVRRAEDSLILVQDYQLALVPRRIREAAPSAPIALFWHIPWPTAEMFSICPWAGELLDGLLGADVVGFHTDDYGDSFLRTVGRLVPDAEVDWRARSIVYRGHRTAVRTYPISVEWPYPAASRTSGRELRRELGLGDDVHVSIAVDRADYTKGLIERVRAVEALLDDAFAPIGRFTLVQVAAPSREAIGRYRDLASELRAEVDRVNRRFARGSWQPVVLRMEALPPEEVRRHYAMADSAIVTPLHDGMNLVAKEYVATCADGRGALILSHFAGAAQELSDALLVNPYDVREVASAIRRVMEMPAAEELQRMRGLRAAVAGNTIYDWSANLLSDLAAVRRERRSDWRNDELLRARGA